METIFIIAGGPSVKNQLTPEILKEFKSKGLTLGVNEAGVLFPCDAVYSMDRKWMENRFDVLQQMERPLFARRCAFEKNLKKTASVSLFDQSIHQDRMSENCKELWGKNSGYCAMNLAYHWRPKRIFLFGFDMCLHKGMHHFHEPYQWNSGGSGLQFNEWLIDFKNAAKQFEDAGIKVFNCSPISKIDHFPFQHRWQELLQYL